MWARWRCATQVDYVERTFRHVADARKLEFEVERAANLARTVHTDAKRPRSKSYKNLLSNAFKFTEKGQGFLVDFTWRPCEGTTFENEIPQPRKISPCLRAFKTRASASRRT